MDTTYYVSITKSFQGDTDALYLAKQPDLVFYDSAEIKLLGLSSAGTILFETGFKKCNMNKLPGIFPESKGYLYSSLKVIDRFSHFEMSGKYTGITQFKLEVRIPGYEPIIESVIRKISPAGIVVPLFDSTSFDFYSTEPPVFIIASGAEDQSDAIDFIIRFRYQDIYKYDTINRRIDILMRRDLFHLDRVDFSIPPELFLNQLSRMIPDDKDVVSRKFLNFDFICLNATSDYKMYINSWELTTSDYHMVDYSNITNARGLFSMKNMFFRYNNTFHYQTLDTIALSPITQHLKFQH